MNNINIGRKTKIINTKLGWRMRYVPKGGDGRTEWMGERGNSLCKPENQKIKEFFKTYGLEGIKYENGIVCFEGVYVVEVKITIFESNRYRNFRRADEACAVLWTKEGRDGLIWTSGMVSKWRKDNKHTWHECNDCETCQLVPTIIHSFFGHAGGIAEQKAK